MAEKKKSKELLLAAIAYAAGRKDALQDAYSGDEAEIVRMGASIALARWKEQTGGKKPQPSEIELARKKWTVEGCPPEGTVYARDRYFFDPDGSYNIVKSFDANFMES